MCGYRLFFLLHAQPQHLLLIPRTGYNSILFDDRTKEATLLDRRLTECVPQQRKLYCPSSEQCGGSW